MTATPIAPQQPQRLANSVPRRRARVSLTPLIDVVFILLVFFMLASSLLDWRSIELDASAKTAAAPSKSDSVIVDVRPDGIRLGGETVALDTLTERLRQRIAKTPDQRVLVEPAPGVVLQNAIVVLDRLSDAGVTNMSLIRDRKP
jgi:biopolymer transport protein ExbD